MISKPSRVASFHNRMLGRDEARQYLESPITDAERDEVLSLVHWFERRYPTPVERLAYVRRAYARWRRTLGIGAGTESESKS